MSTPIPKDQQFKAGDKLVCIIPPRDGGDLVKGQIVQAMSDTEAGNFHTPDAMIRVNCGSTESSTKPFFGYAWRFKLAEVTP